MNRIFTIIFIFLSILSSVKGQYAVNTINEYTTVNSKYTNFPVLQQDGVDLYSGRLKLSYNLLNSFGNDPLLKVLLSYNGGGIRVMEESGKVGLGWNIYSHPTISREVRGLSDIDPIVGSIYNGYPNTNISVPTYSSSFTDSLQQAFRSNGFDLYTDLKSLGISNWDTEPDIFTLNLGDKTIRFVLPQRWGRQVFEAKLINKEDKVKVLFNWSDKTFKVLDEFGNEYVFDVKDYGISASTSSGGGPRYGANDFRINTMYENPVLTVWHASIIRKSNNEEIKYYYRLTNSSETPFISESFSMNACFAGNTNQSFQMYSKSFGTFLTEREVHQIEKIEFPLGVIQFQYSDRADLPLGKGNAPYMTNFWERYHYGTATLNDQKLDKIVLKDISNNAIHEVSLSYTYFNKEKANSTDKTEYIRLKLDKLKIDEDVFAFSYYKQDSLPRKLSHSIDYYGFNNGKQNYGRIPINSLKYYCTLDVFCNNCYKDINFINSNTTSDVFGDRRPSFDEGKIGSLIEVSNNKGQRTVIDYELNNIQYNSSDSINSGYDFNFRDTKEYVALYESKPIQTPVFSIEPGSSNNPVFVYKRICGGDFNKPEGESHYKCQINFEDLQKVAIEVVNATTGAVVKSFYHYDTQITGVDLLPKGNYFIRFNSLHEPWNVISSPGSPDDNKIYYFAAKLTVRESAPSFTNVDIGGLRVKSLKYFDQSSQKIAKYYNYNFFDTDQSSGKLSHPYINYKDEIIERVELGGTGTCLPTSSLIKNVVFNSDPTIYVPNEQPIVSYSNVRETVYDGSSSNGYTNNVFYNLKNEYEKVTSGSYNHRFEGVVEDPFLLWYNYFPIKSYFHINGKLKSSTVFDNLNKKVSQVNYIYESTNYSLSKVVVNGGKVRASNFEQYNCGPIPIISKLKLTTYQPYVVYDMTNPMLKKTSIDFASSNIQKEETWKYRGVNYNLESYTLKGSNGNDQTTKYIFPGDPESVGMSYVNSMIEKNMIQTPLVTTIYNSGKEISKTTFDYSLFHTKFILPLTETNYKGANIVNQFTYDYNIKNARVVHIQKLNSIPSILIWGYNGQYPIGEVKNATYSEVLAILGQSTLDNLNLANVSESTILTAMAKLRSGLPQAMVTTYTYKPLVGMTSKTDARGITEYYKYDGMQRLQAILDHLTYVNRSFDYHYRSN